MGLKRKTADKQPAKTKKKPHRTEPYWSTSKSFVAALKEERPINAVTEWLRAITEHHQNIKFSNGHTDGAEDGPDESNKDQDTENAKNENETGDEAAMDEEAAKEDTQEATEKFADFITPYVDAFFRAGGLVSELLACGRLDTSHLCTIFQALYHIILRGNVLGAIDTSYIAGECVEFLRLNSDNTRHMLSTVRSARQNQLALEFLLAMTTVDKQVAIEVLGVADLKETNARYMTHESTLGVRKAYINLMTGLLVCGDSTVIRAIIIRPYFVTYIMESLVWDPADTVATFLTAIRCHLVQNRSILKAKKSEIFPGEILTSLLRLYRWGGPANKPATVAHFSKKSVAKSARPFLEVDKNELETVTASVHSLLLVLLTDHTFGLVYKDPSIGTKSQRNYLISHIFRYVDKPWNIPALSELFSRTLTANPDVIKSVLQSMKPALEPRSTKEWTKCIELVEKVITGLHPEKVIEESLEDLTLPNLMSVVVDLCVPQILVGVLCGPNGNHFLGLYGSVTHRIAQFMSHMFDNLNKVFESMKDWREQGKMSESDVLKVRRFVNDFLIRHFPPLPIMLKSCLGFMRAPDEMKNQEGSAQETSEGVAEEHTSILRLLLVYLRLCSKDDSLVASVDAENHKILMEMFGTLRQVSDAHPYLRYDFYELLLTLKEPSFAIENESVREHVRTLFADVLSRDENIAVKAKGVLVKLIKNAGLFEGDTDLPVMWLDLYRKYLKIHDLDLMIESAVRASSDPGGYRRKINKADGKIVEKMETNENVEESMANYTEEVWKLFKRWETEEPVLGDKINIWGNVSYELHTISPWLPAFLDVLKERQEQQTSKQLTRRQEFLRHLLTTLLFHSSQAATLIYLVVKRDRRDGTLPADLVDYFKSWKSKGSPQSLFFKGNFISQVTLFLLGEHSHGFDDSVSLTSAIRENIIQGKDDNAARKEIVYLTRVVVFHIVELSQRAMLTSQIAQRCGQTLCAVLSLAQDLHNEALRQCLQVFLSNFNVISQFSPFDRDRSASTANLTSIVVAVLQKSNTLCEVKSAESVISALKRPFKCKMLRDLRYELKYLSLDVDTPITVVEHFEYSFEEITEILTNVVTCIEFLFTEKILNPPRDLKVSEMIPNFWGHLVALLLQRAADSKEAAALPDDIVDEFSKHLEYGEDHSNPKLACFEKAFLNYLKFRPQQTKFVSRGLLPTLFKVDTVGPERVELAAWLCKRFEPSNVSNCLTEAMLNNGERFQENLILVLEAMKGAYSQQTKGVKRPHFESCTALISRQIRSIVTGETEAPKWLAPYVDFVVTLLAEQKRYSIGKAAISGLVKKPPVLTLGNFFYVDLISGLFWNASGGECLPQLTLLYLTWISNYLQKRGKKDDDVLFISKMCHVILKKLDSSNLNSGDVEKETADGPKAGSDAKGAKRVEKGAGNPKKKTKSDQKRGLKWDDVLDSETWMKFVPLALMFGLQPTNIENEAKDCEARSLVLRSLGRIMKEIYSYRADNVQIATTFKLAITHSEFQPCMTTTGPVRLELAKILKVLIELSPSLMEGDHFPLFLTLYRATMDPADRLILQFLDKYESANIVPPKYRSFLWGQDGASVYATMNERNSLQEYDTNRLFNLFSNDVVQRTIMNFPLRRTLDIEESDDTTAPASCSESYDPAFYLPLLSNVTSPESPLKTFTFVRSGALALTLVSLASEVENVRRMAYSILTRFVDHLYMSKGMQVEVLNRFMDSLRIGVTSLMKGDEMSSPCISSVVAIFLARTSMIICNPLAPMFTALNTFLLSKVEINLESVPEFLACMHSPTADFRDQRTWMLENLASGLRTEMDFLLCFHNEVPIFRLLMDMFTSCVSDIDTKLRIVKVMTAAVTIRSGATWLTFNSGLISWLSSSCQFGFAKNAAIVDAVVTFVSTLWKPLLDAANGAVGPSHHIVKHTTSSQLLRLLLHFVPSVSLMEAKTLSTYLLAVHDLHEAGHPETSLLLNYDVMKSIIEASSPGLPSIVGTKCRSIVAFGCDFVDEEEPQSDTSAVDEAARSLEALTKSWVRLRNNQV